DLFEMAAHSVGRLGLHVERIDMARPAELVEKHHRFGPGGLESLVLSRTQEMRKRQTEHSLAADRQSGTTVERPMEEAGHRAGVAKLKPYFHRRAYRSTGGYDSQ